MFYCAFVVLLNERNIYNKRMNLIRCVRSIHFFFVIVFVEPKIIWEVSKRSFQLIPILILNTISLLYLKSFHLKRNKMTEESKERTLWKLLRLDNKFKAGFLSVHTNLVGLEFDAFLCVSGMEKVSSMFQMIAWQPYFKAWHWQIFTLWWRRERGEEVQKYPWLEMSSLFFVCGFI